jgi:hypothetical protein
MFLEVSGVVMGLAFLTGSTCPLVDGRCALRTEGRPHSCISEEILCGPAEMLQEADNIQEC